MCTKCVILNPYCHRISSKAVCTTAIPTADSGRPRRTHRLDKLASLRTTYPPPPPGHTFPRLCPRPAQAPPGRQEATEHPGLGGWQATSDLLSGIQGGSPPSALLEAGCASRCGLPGRAHSGGASRGLGTLPPRDPSARRSRPVPPARAQTKAARYR